jgi:F-type H+-transporting ATPase subunit f
MNAIFRRAYTTKTLIPPNVAAATRLSGSAKDGQITQLVDFYKVKNYL